DHHRGVLLKPFALKGGMNEAPLGHMKAAFARQQPFAEQNLRSLQEAALMQHHLLLDQHLPHEDARADDVQTLPAKGEVGNIRILDRNPLEECDRVLPEGRKMAENGRVLRTSRAYHLATGGKLRSTLKSRLFVSTFRSGANSSSLSSVTPRNAIHISSC